MLSVQVVPLIHSDFTFNLGAMRPNGFIFCPCCGRRRGTEVKAHVVLTYVICHGLHPSVQHFEERSHSDRIEQNSSYFFALISFGTASVLTCVYGQVATAMFRVPRHGSLLPSCRARSIESAAIFCSLQAEHFSFSLTITAFLRRFVPGYSRSE